MASSDLFLKDDSPTKETTALLRADNDAAVNSNSPQPPYRGQPHDDTLAHSVHWIHARVSSRRSSSRSAANQMGVGSGNTDQLRDPRIFEKSDDDRWPPRTLDARLWLRPGRQDALCPHQGSREVTLLLEDKSDRRGRRCPLSQRSGSDLGDQGLGVPVFAGGLQRVHQ